MYFLREIVITCVLVCVYSFDTHVNMDEINSVYYQVDVMGLPVLEDQASHDNAMTIVNKYGQKYICNLPPISHLDWESKKEEEPEELSIDVSALLKPMEEEVPCLRKRIHWWTYEFCYGFDVKQYHVEDSKVIGPIIILGQYESEYDWNNSSESKNKLQKFHTQHYINGTRCDIIGKQRKAEVRFHCSESANDHIRTVDEPESCSYVMTIGTPRVCQHPYLKNHVERPPHAITCQPALNFTQMIKFQDNQYKNSAADVEDDSCRKETPTADSNSPETSGTTHSYGEASTYPYPQGIESIDDTYDQPIKMSRHTDDELREMDALLADVLPNKLLDLRKGIDEFHLKPQGIHARVIYLRESSEHQTAFLESIIDKSLDEMKVELREKVNLHNLNLNLVRNTITLLQKDKESLLKLDQQITDSYTSVTEELKSIQLVATKVALHEAKGILETFSNTVYKLIKQSTQIKFEVEYLEPLLMMQARSTEKLYRTVLTAENMNKEISAQMSEGVPTRPAETETEVKSESDPNMSEGEYEMMVQLRMLEKLNNAGYDTRDYQISIFKPTYNTESEDIEINNSFRDADGFRSMIADMMDFNAGEMVEKKRHSAQQKHYNFKLQEIETDTVQV